MCVWDQITIFLNGIVSCRFRVCFWKSIYRVVELSIWEIRGLAVTPAIVNIFVACKCMADKRESIRYERDGSIRRSATDKSRASVSGCRLNRIKPSPAADWNCSPDSDNAKDNGVSSEAERSTSAGYLELTESLNGLNHTLSSTDRY